MGTDKRERKKANKAAKLEAERAAAKKAQQVATIKRVVIIAVVVLVGMVLFSALTGCGSSDSEGADATASTTEAAAEEAQPCETAPDGVRQTTFDEPPTAELQADTTYTATFETSEGTVAVELDTERTPDTTANFIALANACYYDGTELFRTEASTGIIQGGGALTNDNTDPGPGYTIPDEGGTFTTDDYAPGTLAMARTQAPDSASSQFFFLANEGGRYLGDPNLVGPSAGSYVVFGQTTEGLDVLEAIAALESAPGSGTPSKTVTIDSVRISES